MIHNVRAIAFTAGFAIGCLSLVPDAVRAADAKPNIVLIVADDK